VTLLAAWLRRWAASPWAHRSVLRGSHVTAQWVPRRPANDLDLLLLEDATAESLTPQLVALAAMCEDGMPIEVEAETIWAQTEWPGVRLHLARGEGLLQVDVGWGDPLAAPPRPIEVAGVVVPAVTAEVMFGWKVHGLVELAPRGRWHPKTLADVVLLHRHAPLERAVTRAAIELAFRSRAMTTDVLDPFLNDPTWGRSRSTRRKWRSFQKKTAWARLELEEAIELGRRAVRYFLEASPPAGT
jgi:hypothetical protein